MIFTTMDALKRFLCLPTSPICSLICLSSSMELKLKSSKPLCLHWWKSTTKRTTILRSSAWETLLSSRLKRPGTLLTIKRKSSKSAFLNGQKLPKMQSTRLSLIWNSRICRKSHLNSSKLSASLNLIRESHKEFLGALCQDQCSHLTWRTRTKMSCSESLSINLN